MDMSMERIPNKVFLTHLFFVILRYKVGQTDRHRLQGTTVSILLSGMWAAIGPEAKFSFLCMWFCPSKGTDEIFNDWTERWVLSEKTRLN